MPGKDPFYPDPKSSAGTPSSGIRLQGLAPLAAGLAGPHRGGAREEVHRHRRLLHGPKQRQGLRVICDEAFASQAAPGSASLADVLLFVSRLFLVWRKPGEASGVERKRCFGGEAVGDF